jgi:hypothetical protein
MTALPWRLFEKSGSNGRYFRNAAALPSAAFLSAGCFELLGFFPASHVLQISDDKIDLAVTQIDGKRRHALSGPGAHGFWVADQIAQSLQREIFSRILRAVEVGADIGSTGPIQLVAGQALNDKESLAGADRIV